MKNWSRRLLALLMVVTWSLVAHAGDADFMLINKTGYEIEAVFASPAKQRSWGSDFLKDGTLRDGERVMIAFNKNRSTCIYDLRIQWVGYDEDEDAIWERLDLCAVRKITLRYNRKSNETIAEFD